jgi:hypothetical protein
MQSLLIILPFFLSFFRKAVFDAMQKKVQEERKTREDKKMQESKKMQHGAWGPVFKNKQHFVNMHIC